MQADRDHELEILAGPRVEAAVVPREAVQAAAEVLSDEQRELLRGVLNQIVPPRGALPGAGDLGVGLAIERTLSASARLRRLFLEGLAEIELAAGRAAGRGFGGLASDEQAAVLRLVELARPAFFEALVEHGYRGYYVLPKVHAAIGYDSRPPQPLGYALPPFDERLLERQRAREPFWRRTE